MLSMAPQSETTNPVKPNVSRRSVVRRNGLAEDGVKLTAFYALLTEGPPVRATTYRYTRA